MITFDTVQTADEAIALRLVPSTCNTEECDKIQDARIYVSETGLCERAEENMVLLRGATGPGVTYPKPTILPLQPEKG